MSSRERLGRKGEENDIEKPGESLKENELLKEKVKPVKGPLKNCLYRLMFWPLAISWQVKHLYKKGPIY